MKFIDKNSLKTRKDSIAIDNGNNKYIKNYKLDILGQDRINNNKVDIGAYEYYKDDSGGIILPIEGPEEIEIEKHFAYIEGYEDNTIKPENNATREKVAAMFYRLLDDDFKDKIYTEISSFPDILKSRWSSEYIETLEKGKIIQGYTRL